MVKIDNKGRKFEDLPEYKVFIRKIREMGFDLDMIPFTRHTQFKGEPCEVCGATKFILGKGRYVIFNSDDESPDQITIFLCGNCLKNIEEWEVGMDFM